MAFDIFDLAAKISLDSTALEEGLQKTQGSLSAGAVAMGNLASNAISTALSKTVDFAKSSIKAGADFDSAMAQVAATSGVTMDELNSNVVTVGNFTGSLRDFAQQEGATTAFSATQAAEALNYMALAGYDAKKSVKMLPNVLNLAAAGGMDLAAASDMVTDAQSALGLSLDQTNVMVDQMAKASSTTNTSVSQLGEAILTVGGTAKSMKGGTEELSAVLGVLADNGIKGAEGGTHLRNMILSLSSPTDNASVALDKLGISLYDAQGNMRSLSDVFQDLNKSMEGMTDEQKTQTIAAIFNKTDIKAVNALLGTNAERWDQVYSAIDDAAGSAQQMADTQLDNLSGDITIFQSALEGAQIAISDGLSPTLREFVQMGTEGLSQFTEGIKEGGVQGAAEAVGEWLANAITQLASMIPTIIQTGIQVVEGFISGMAQAVPQIIETAKGAISNFAQGITTNLPTVIAKAQELITDFSNAVQNDLPQILAQGVAFVQNLVNGIVQGLPSFLDTAVQLITGFLKAVINALPQILNAGMQILTAVVNGIVESLPEIIEAAGEIITSLLDTILDNLPEIIEGGLQMLEAIVQGIMDNLPEIISAIIEVVAKIVVTIAEHLPEILQAGIDILEMLITGLINTIPDLVAAIPQIIQSIKDKFGEYDWGSIGSNIIDGIKNGISSAAGRIADAAKEAARKALDAAKDFLGIHSPSTVFRDQIGKYMALGMAEGFEDNIPVDGMQNSLDGMVDRMSNMVRGNMQFSTEGVNRGATYNGGITINVYGAQGQSEQQLVDILMDEITRRTGRTKAVWA